MPEKPKPSADDLVRVLFQLEAAGTDAQMQQMLNRLSRQTFVGGKRVPIETVDPAEVTAWLARLAKVLIPAS